MKERKKEMRTREKRSGGAHTLSLPEDEGEIGRVRWRGEIGRVRRREGEIRRVRDIQSEKER